MLERIEIRNFRNLNDFEIERLGRINLIAGRNNSGKTSLLEAVFLLSGAGNPQMLFNVNVTRVVDPNLTMWPVHHPWKELFSELDVNKVIEITAHHGQLGRLALKITSERPHTTEIPLDPNNKVPLEYIPEEKMLTFRYENSKGEPVESRMRLTKQGIEFPRLRVPPPFIAAIISSLGSTIQEDAARLGTLRKQKRGHLLLEALQVIEPRLTSLENISVSSAGGTPMIWGDIGLPELIPLPVMGEGMTRLARFVLAISDAPNGIALLDEIENGLHHSLLPKVWQVVDATARQCNTQVFATTHSRETIMAAHDSLGSDAFRLHRLETTDSMNRCVTYEPESISAAIRHDFEVR